MSAIKYLFVMAIAWGTIFAHALILPAIIGIYTLWTYCYVDKRKQPGASWVQDTLAALPIIGGGPKSIPGWEITRRERRRQICVVRGLWMPIVIGIPTLIASLLVLVGPFIVADPDNMQSADLLPMALLALFGSIGYLGYRIAREPNNGWSGKIPKEHQ